MRSNAEARRIWIAGSIAADNFWISGYISAGATAADL